VVAASAGDDGGCASAGCAEICLSSAASSGVSCSCPSDSSTAIAADDRRLCRGLSFILSATEVEPCVKFLQLTTRLKIADQVTVNNSGL